MRLSEEFAYWEADFFNDSDLLLFQKDYPAVLQRLRATPLGVAAGDQNATALLQSVRRNRHELKHLELEVSQQETIANSLRDKFPEPITSYHEIEGQPAMSSGSNIFETFSWHLRGCDGSSVQELKEEFVKAILYEYSSGRYICEHTQ